MKKYISNITSFLDFIILFIFTINIMGVNRVNARSEFYNLNTKIYVDDPELVEEAVSVERAKALLDSINLQLAIHGITLITYYEILPTDDFFKDPKSFFGRWPECNDPSKLAIYLRPSGFGAIAGCGSGRGQLWSEADINTLGHELGHVFGLQHTISQYECLSEKGRGDGIDDTPFHPPLFDEDEKPFPNYFDGCNVLWTNVKDVCGQPVVDTTAQNYISIIKNYRTNLENNFMAQIYHPHFNNCEPKSYTIGQGARMRSWIASRLRKFIAYPNEESSKWRYLKSDITSDTTFSGVVVIENPIVINHKVKFKDGIVLLRQNANLTLASDSDVTFHNVIIENYNICQHESNNKVIVEKGCHFDFYKAQIRDLSGGIEIYSDNGRIEKVLFGYLGISDHSGVKIINLDNLGYHQKSLVVTDVEFINADVHIENSSVELKGPKFFLSDMNCLNSNIIINVSKSNRKPSFSFKSTIDFNSGSLLHIDNAYFQTEVDNSVITVDNCDKLILSRNLFLGSNRKHEGLLNIQHIAEHYLFENIFSGHNYKVLQLYNSPKGIIRNNIFKKSEIGININSSGHNYHLECNIHDKNNIAWKLDKGVQINAQGMKGLPSNNMFIESTTHVENDLNFTYYSNRENENHLDELKSNDVSILSTDNYLEEENTLEYCKSEDVIYDNWETWDMYGHVFLYEWESLLDDDRRFVKKSVALPDYYNNTNLDSKEGKLVLEDDKGKQSSENLEDVNVILRKLGNYNPVDTEAAIFPNPAIENLSISVNAGAQSKIFDAAGQLVVTNALEKGVNDLAIGHLPNGMYHVEIDFDSGSTINRRLVKK